MRDDSTQFNYLTLKTTGEFIVWIWAQNKNSSCEIFYLNINYSLAKIRIL